jgi:hypothetical protein
MQASQARTSPLRLITASFVLGRRREDVKVRRNASLNFDNQIRGTVWIDEVKITSQK